MTIAIDKADGCGILYVATNREEYLVEARASASSLKRHCPNLPICVFTDLTESKLAEDNSFDLVLPVTADTECGTEWGRGLRARMLSLPQSPFERTLHLDTDTRFMSDAVGELFGVLEDHDIGMVQDPPDVSIGIQHYGRPMFNGGVILYRKNNAVLTMFEQWQRLFLLQLEAHAQDPMPHIDYMAGIQNDTARRKMLLNDQFALAQLLSPEKNVFDLKLKILDDAWNFCGTFAGRTLNRPIHIDHGPHLKADAFSRNVRTSKPGSLNEMTGRLIAGLAKSNVELEHGSKRRCLTILEETIQSVPNQSLVQVPLAREMIRRGRFAEAQELAELAILADPDCYPAFVELATALFNQGDAEGAAECVKRCRSRFPGELGILSLAHVIQAERGGSGPPIDEPDYDSFLMTTRLELDPVLKQDLQDFISHQWLLETERPEGTHANFFRSAALGRLAGPAIAALKNEISPHFQDYIERISGHNHPFVKARPTKMGMACWGTVTGRRGCMAPHIHKNSWVSGVTYLRVPDSIHKSKTKHAGWIEFGRPPLDQYRYSFEPQTLTIEPDEGMLLLFPSYYWHGTISHASDDLRISFGFNLLRASTGS